jgi:hypothetical protein
LIYFTTKKIIIRDSGAKNILVNLNKLDSETVKQFKYIFIKRDSFLKCEKAILPKGRKTKSKDVVKYLWYYFPEKFI